MVGSPSKKQKTEQSRVDIYDKIERVQLVIIKIINKNFEFESVHKVGA